MQTSQIEYQQTIPKIITTVSLRFLGPTQAFGEVHITFPDQNIVAQQSDTGFERVLTATNVGGSLVPTAAEPQITHSPLRPNLFPVAFFCSLFNANHGQLRHHLLGNTVP